jgi:hypothetical protein
MNTIKLGFKLIEVDLSAVQQQVDVGWSGILERLINDLFELGWNGEVLQIKEKFGGLRFYTNGSTEAIHQRIVQAENESFKVCERCGKPGVPRLGGWTKTLCDEHAEGREPFEDFV